ncbi:MAG: hypothetical protein H3C26_15795 [Rhodocyclaceae bacterium]|nr:hypothetical protein [Rhodocyclaceae bacterium]
MSNPLIALGHAMRGAVPAAMEIDHQRENQRRFDLQESRAAEELGMRKQSHGAQMAVAGLQRIKLQRETDDDTALREHLTAWRDGRQKIQAGDFAAFEMALSEYNTNQGWSADGFTMKPRLDDNGRQVLDRYDATGKLIDSSPPLTRGAVLGLFDMGMAGKMKWLNPKRYDEAAARAAALQAKDAEWEHKEKVATGNNATSLEVARISQSAADRRHAGTLALQRDRLEFDKARGGLTLAQQRSNFEIDAAREMLDGMSEDEVRRRTTPTTATGRENPDFDPALARAAKLASRRRIGDDDWFDQRQGRPPSNTFASKPLNQMTDAQLEQIGRQAGNEGRLKIDAELARRSLAGMKGAEGYSVGQYVEGKGFQVLDASGRPVSWLRRRAQ